jgi:hypothetical protein
MAKTWNQRATEVLRIEGKYGVALFNTSISTQYMSIYTATYVALRNSLLPALKIGYSLAEVQIHLIKYFWPLRAHVHSTSLTALSTNYGRIGSITVLSIVRKNGIHKPVAPQ